MMLVSENDLGRIPSFWIIWNSFRRDGNSSFLRVWENWAVNPYKPGLFVCARLLIATSTSDLVIGLFMVLTSFWIRIGRMQVSRNLSISSRLTSLCA